MTDNEFNVANFFENCGYKVIRAWDPVFYAEGDIFLVKQIDNVLKFTVKEMLGKSGKPVDFLTSVPTNELQALKKISIVLDLYEAIR